MSTQTEVRGEHRVFSGSDPAYTAIGQAAIAVATPALTPLMLGVTVGTDAGLLIPWDGVSAGQAVAVLALDHDGVSTTCSYYKSGTFDINAILWPAGLDIAIKRNAFMGTAISVA